MPTLILSPRYSDDSITLRRAAISLGWDVMRLASWRCPDDFEPEGPVLHAEPLFNTAVAEQLGLALIEPHEDFLVRLPREYVGRDVRLLTAAEARTFPGAGSLAGGHGEDRRGGATRIRGKLHPYVGPEVIRSRWATGRGGRVIESPEDLRTWLTCHRPCESGDWIAATLVIDPDGRLRLADRRSEHVACAAGGPVLSAGEMSFTDQGDAAIVEEVTNLSTGDCPEPESWPVVGHALDRLGVVHPGWFTTEVIFRRPDHRAEWLRMRKALWEDCPDKQQVREMEGIQARDTEDIFVAE